MQEHGEPNNNNNNKYIGTGKKKKGKKRPLLSVNTRYLTTYRGRVFCVEKKNEKFRVHRGVEPSNIIAVQCIKDDVSSRRTGSIQFLPGGLCAR